MKDDAPQPSQLALRFFRWFCRPAFREELEGDLLERFHRCAETKGGTKAQWLLLHDVFALFRPSVIGNIFPSANKNTHLMTLQTKRLIIILSTAFLLCSIPLIAMQFTHEVNWSGFDFLVAAILLFGTGLMLELILRKVKTLRFRWILGISLLIILFLLWVELAVGIFGSPIAGS